MRITLAELEDLIFPLVAKPNRYIAPFPAGTGRGAEVCLLHPRPYETTWALPGVRSLIDALGSSAGFPFDVAAVPAADLSDELARCELPVFGVGERRPLRDYRIVLIIPDRAVDLAETLALLRAGDVPLRSKARADADPLVLLAGPASAWPSAAAPFVDAILAGDPEAWLPLMGELAGLDRTSALDRLDRETGIGRDDQAIVPRWLDALPPASPQPIGLVSEIDEDGYPLEIARPHGTDDPSRPNPSLRTRSRGECVDAVETGIAATGYARVNLGGDSAAVHPDLDRMLEEVHQRIPTPGFGARVPRVDAAGFTPSVARELRKTSGKRIAFRPVAVSERMRAAAGRPLSREVLESAVRLAARGGWSVVRMGLVLGSPGETARDHDEAFAMLESLHRLRGSGTTSPKLVLELIPFQPGSADELRETPDPVFLDGLAMTWKARLGKGGRYQIVPREPRRARVESFLRWGGAQAADALETVVRAGARRQGEPDLFVAGVWEPVLALDPTGLPPSPVLDRGTDVSLNITFETPDSAVTAPAPVMRTAGRRARRGGPQKEARRADRYRLRFAKEEPLRFTAHLDVGRALERALRRAQVPIAMSQGKDRRPRIAFGPPLPLGMTSRAETVDLALARDLPETFVEPVNAVLPPGLRIIAAAPIRNQAASLASAIQLAEYEIGFPDALLRESFDGMPFEDLRNRLAESLDHILAGDSLEITRVRKDRVQTFNGRPSLLQAEIVRDDGGRPAIKCRLTINRSDSARPESLTSALCTWTEFDPRLLRVHRTGLFIPGRDRPLDPLEVVRQDFAWWSRPVRGGTAV